MNRINDNKAKWYKIETKKQKHKKAKELRDFKVYVFDLDNTLYLHRRDAENEFHKQLKRNLQVLKDSGKKLYIATHNKRPIRYLQELGIEDMFDKVIYEMRDVGRLTHSIKDYTSKKEMINDVISYGYNISDIVFFDDAKYNINKVSELGVKCVLVDGNKGVVFEELIPILP